MKSQVKRTIKTRSSKSGSRPPKANSSKAVTAPVARSNPLVSRGSPRFQNNGLATTVTNSELVTILKRTPASGTSFQQFSFEIQPGVALTFPWLSVIAQRYETYQFRKLLFRFSSRSTSITEGTVGAVFDHDPLDPAPSTLTAALAYHDRIAHSPWVSWDFPVDLRGSANHPLFTRGSAIAGSDLKTYDIGSVTFFLDGITTDSTLGLLEVCYTVDLFIPQIEENPVETGTLRSNAPTADNLLPNGQISSGVPPVSIDKATGIMTFLQPFEGVITSTLNGQNLTGALNMLTTGMQAIAFLHSGYGLSQQMLSHKVKAPVGATLHPYYTGSSTLLSVSDFDFIPAVYSLIA